jgi:hypothetical protein
MTRHSIRALAFSGLAAALAIFAPPIARAQSSQRGQPRTPFGASDFAKLRWLEGTWAGRAAGESPIFARYHVVSDSTLEISYFRDSSFAQPSGTGRVYLTVGRIFQTFGPGRWGASNVDSTGVFFVPQLNAHSSLAWSRQSPDVWTLTQRTGLGGHERVTVYQMKRVRP